MQFLFIPTSHGFDGVEMTRCPACGADVVAAPCPHLLFTFADEAGEFENVAPRVQDAVDASERRLAELQDADDDAADSVYLPEAVSDAAGLESAVCFSFGSNGTGGGYSVAIDFEP